MISMNNVNSVGQALCYFSADSYYTQDEGLEHSEWFDKEAEHLGLSGKIDRQAFFRVLNGKVDGQELSRWIKNEETGEKEREHRPGTGMTFSAPKSVSLMAEAYGKRDMRKAHGAAVKKALSHIETELARTRQTVDGKTEVVQTGNVTVIMLRHSMGRDLDPQTHAHAIIMNATKREDGQWYSLTNEEIYNAQHVIRAIYTSELTDRLQALGYNIYRTDEEGNFEIASTTREQIEHFSQHQVEIEVTLKAKGADIDDASVQRKEDATLKARAREVDVDHKALTRSWKERAKDIGIDFDAIQAKADAQQAQGDVVCADRLTGREAMSFTAAYLIECEAAVSRNDPMTAAIRRGAERVSASEVKRAFDKLGKNSDPATLPDSDYTTKKMLDGEMWALDQMHAQKGQTPKMMEPEAVTTRIARAENRQGFKYSGGQKETVSKVLTTEGRYVVMQDLAGTGKATMLKDVRRMAQEQGYTVRDMAPTRVVSKVLTRETGITTDTVSMFQIKERQLQKNIEFAKQYTPNFQRKAEVWIVDESSFLSQCQKAQFDHIAEKAGAKVACLGNTLQLQGIEADKPFELAQQDGMETAYITEINRRKTADLKQAVGIITGRGSLGDGQHLTQVELANSARVFEYMDKAGMIQEIPEKSEDDRGRLMAAVAQDILKLNKAEREHAIVITAYNGDRRTINAGVREGLEEQDELSRSEDTREIYTSKGWTRAMQKEAQYYEAGGVVHFGRDCQQINAEKGEYMYMPTMDAPNDTVVLQEEDDPVIAWQPRKHNKIEVYNRDIRELAKGDLTRITRNKGKFKNGEVVRITAVARDEMTLELKQGRDVSLHQMDLFRNKHWNHIYAQTVHASQGATQHRVIFHIRAPQTESEKKQGRAPENVAKVFEDRSFYVGATRTSHELRTYTNDKAVAAKTMAAKRDKTSAVETLRQHERATVIATDKAEERPMSPRRNGDVQRQSL